MKTLTSNLLGIVLMSTLVLVSCDDGLLEIENTTELTPDNLLTDVSGAETYLIGAYGQLQNTAAIGKGGVDDGVDIRSFGIYWGTCATDIIVVPSYVNDGRVDIFSQTVPASLPVINAMWVNFYKAINRTNSVIDRVGAMERGLIDAEDQTRIIAEARFIRALLYFDLVVPYENIVLNKTEVTDPENYEGAQAPPEEVYNFIVEDLKFAAANLEPAQGGGRATQGAAQALLGKVYLQMTGYPLNQTDKFALAEAEFIKVVNSGVYALLPSYRDVFTLDGENSEEMIFAIGMDGPAIGEGGLLSTFYGPGGGQPNEGAGWGTCTVNVEFAQSYDAENDERSRNNIAKHSAGEFTPEEGFSDPTTWGTFAGGWRGWKWHSTKPNDYANDSPFDNPIIRYSDVLLMHAEALNGQNKLTQADMDMTVNAVRARARMDDAALPDLAVGSQAENSDNILAERRWELCLEGWRRNDLIRFGKYKEIITAIDQVDGGISSLPKQGYEDHEIVWPIPQEQIDKFPSLKQNPGY